MYSPVIKHASAFAYVNMPVMHISIKSIETVFHHINVPESLLVKDFFHDPEILIQTPLMVNRKFHSALICYADHVIQFLRRHGCRLLTYDIFSCFCRLYNQIVMLVIICRNQYNVHFRVCQKRLVAFVSF